MYYDPVVVLLVAAPLACAIYLAVMPLARK